MRGKITLRQIVLKAKTTISEVYKCNYYFILLINYYFQYLLQFSFLNQQEIILKILKKNMRNIFKVNTLSLIFLTYDGPVRIPG